MGRVTTRSIRKILRDIAVAQEKSNEESRKRNEETELKLAKLRAENEEKLAKLRAEADAARKEREEYEKISKKKMDEMFGRLGISHGEYVEAMFVNLFPKFDEHKLHFRMEGPRLFRDKDGQPVVQIDRLLENGEKVMAVEVKAKLKQGDVDNHIKRLRKLSGHMKAAGDDRAVLGAVAGGVVHDNLLKYAHNRGLFVLVQNGESISIAEPPEGFAPAIW